MTATFHTTRNELSDGSATLDVYLSDDQGQVLVAEPPSSRTAIELADTLNRVLRAYLDCGSDHQVMILSGRLNRVLGDYLS